ncbi:DUF4442 domain-containing protein [Pararhodonellum marinum]|uniref:DUF4442 domain-containing protein n=1 Tax=Pararhodonellum marinum TaxID=2755358 RepID=UPI00188FC549|nr:DUF4442 domain-containing protein [Pararhodonellum marinum]
MNPAQEKFKNQIRNPFYFWWGMLFKLPTVLFWRIRITHLDESNCQVTLPYFWRSQNPFKSIYFAAMSGAAELSTGVLCQYALAGKGKFSMLVVGLKAEFFKKANQKITFTCQDGLAVRDLLGRLEPGESETLTMVAFGTNPEKETVAKFYITWSFKRKS